jgi:two-component system, OmpR family, response regulator
MERQFWFLTSETLEMHLKEPALLLEEIEIGRSDCRDQVLGLEGLRALIVDDDKDTRDLFSFVLKGEGAEVTEAASAVEALSAASDWHPDVLICDICLPGEDGYALLHKIRALEARVGKHIPAIAITAFPLKEEDFLRMALAGFRKCLLKPTDIEELITTIAELAEQKQTNL